MVMEMESNWSTSSSSADVLKFSAWGSVVGFLISDVSGCVGGRTFCEVCPFFLFPSHL